jgi:peptidoglycan-associated lipoprotein
MKNLLVFAILASMLSACAGTRIKEEPKVAPPSVAQTQSNNTIKEPTPAVTAPTNENKIESNPLKDPKSILSKRSIYFDFDKYEVKPEFRKTIEAHSKYLLDHPESVVRLEGNADERGSREFNLALGQKRAAAVEKAMNLLGVPNKQVETISYGEERPRSDGKDEVSWGENRRTDILYYGE